ncbi:MAG: FtsB family cell division protein [Desulfobacterales bacterium]
MTIKHKFFLAVALIVILSTLLLIVFGENGLTDRKHLKSRYLEVVSENTAIAKENARLYRQIERLKNDPAFIESIARRELGMVGSNEVIVKPINPVSPGSVNHVNGGAGGVDGNP